MSNRETWLENAKKELSQKFFLDNGYKLPEKVQVSCGFPRGSSKAIGQCFDPEVCEDGTVQIFISPCQSDPIRVLDILLHELIHAAVGIKEGHKGNFRKLAKEFGLAGKMTATYAEVGSSLWEKLAMIAGKLGRYPHGSIKLKKKKKKSDGWIRLYSVEHEAYKITISPKQYEEFGAPLDPWGTQMQEVKR